MEDKVKNNDFQWFSETKPTIEKRGHQKEESQLTMEQLLIQHVQSMLNDLATYRESKIQPLYHGTDHWSVNEQACWDVMLRLVTAMESHPKLKLELGSHVESPNVAQYISHRAALVDADRP